MVGDIEPFISWYTTESLRAGNNDEVRFIADLSYGSNVEKKLDLFFQLGKPKRNELPLPISFTAVIGNNFQKRSQFSGPLPGQQLATHLQVLTMVWDQLQPFLR
ncbi:MAG: hypothetical protein CM1200mP39_25890 [Dehalococcoidia bacterium]|nr:MAG: hypothetical protein CM1200mP39_25890 [Dehalococcoidia bacterium]